MKPVFAFLLLTSSLFVSAQNNDEYVALCKAFGFLHGQQSTINFIKENYPELKTKAEEANIQFDSKFGLAMSNIDTQIKKLLGDKFDYFVNSYNQQISEGFKSVNKNSIQNASFFIEEINNRSNGYIQTPIFENILHYQYKDNPEGEFAKNYVNSYEINVISNDKKATYSLIMPKSWKEIATKFSQSKKFKSRMGYGNEIVTVFFSDIEGEKPSIALENNTKTQKIGNHQFIIKTSVEVDPSIDSKLKKGQLTYSTTIKRLNINMYCHIYDKSEQELYIRMEKFKPLFESIASSLNVVYTDEKELVTYKM
ncbi:MAG: hypothetical protein KDC74_07590 [Flavobacteriaceae bacterium]|nr:hypothetical protein [Flavobacteriaceae bacterium]